MKARAVVFTHLQLPFTVLGLPPKLAMASFMSGLMAQLNLAFMGLQGAAYLGFFTVTVGCGIGSYFIAKREPHIETVFPANRRFWRSSARRWLVTGAPSGGSLGRRA